MNTIAERIKKEFENRGYHAEFKNIQKDNERLKALCVTSPDNPANGVVVYTDRYTEADDVDVIVGETIRQLINYPEFNVDEITKPEYIQNHVKLRVCRSDWNREMLSDLVNEELQGTDLSFYAYIDVGSQHIAKVKKDFCTYAGITEAEVLRWAKKNTPAKVTTMFGVMTMIPEAGAIHDTEAIEEFANGKSYWIVPSSIHEVLLFDKGLWSLEDVNKAINEVNGMGNCIQPEEILSDHAYLFENGEIKMPTEVTFNTEIIDDMDWDDYYKGVG